jgi:hypothetical protein
LQPLYPAVARTSLDGAIQPHLLRSFLLLRIIRNKAQERIASGLGAVLTGRSTNPKEFGGGSMALFDFIAGIAPANWPR